MHSLLELPRSIVLPERTDDKTSTVNTEELKTELLKSRLNPPPEDAWL